MALSAAIQLMAMAAALAAGQDAVPPAQSAAATPACVAIVLPSARGVDGDATAFSTSLRELFMSYLTGPSLRAIALDARLPAQAIEEARQKDCGNVLLTTVTRVRHDGNGVGRALGRAAGTAASYGIPYGGSAAGAAARSAAVAGAYAISNMSYSTKAKDEITLEYRIGTLDRVTSASPTSRKAKAKQDGEDLLTPMVETAASAIAAVVSKP
jgi:hypothetical protein